MHHIFMGSRDCQLAIHQVECLLQYFEYNPEQVVKILLQVQSVIMRDVKAIGAARSLHETKSAGKQFFVDPAFAKAAFRLVDKAFDSCSQVE